MAESLLSVPIGHVSQANAVFGSRPGVLVARPGGRGLSWWFTIPSGYYALVQSYGAQIDHPNGGRVWPAGFYIGGPWMSVSHLVTKQSIIFDSPARDCPTSDDLPVSIDVAVVFRIMGDAEKKEDPNLVQNFIFKVTPTGLKDQLGAALDEAVRGLVRAVRATEVYGLRSGATDNRPGTPESKDGEPDHGDVDAAQAASKKGVGVTEKIRADLNRVFMPQGIEIEQVVIKNVTLPPHIQQQMENKTLVISKQKEQHMLHKNKMQQTSFDEELQTLGQTHNEAAQRTGAEGAARLSQAEVQLKSVKAETEKELSAISTKVGIECRQLEADAGLAVESTLTEAAVINDKLVADGRVDAADIVNTARRDADTALAEAQLTAARNASQATILIAEAEGTAAPMLAAQKTYQSEKAKIEVLQALGGNKDVVVSASDDPTAGKLLLVDAILQKGAERERRGDATSSRSQMLAEMFVMQEGSRVTLNMPAEYSGERR